MDLSQILLNAQSPDRNIRLQAEKHLQLAEQQNLPAFFLALCCELASSTKNPHSRRLAGLILKNALDAKDEARRQQRTEQWIALDASTKLQLKAQLLQTLADTEKDARRTAAQVVAKIAVIELPRNQWPDLIDLLVKNMTQAESPLKQATLETLGYICEELPAESIKDKTNQVLTAVIQGMRKDESSIDVRLAGANALLNALEFVRANFDKELERNYIMQVVCEATQATDSKMRVAAFECLVRIASLYYDKLSTWMQNIFNITLEAIRKDEDAVAQQAIEFWSTICDVEIDILVEIDECANMKVQPPRTCQNFIKGALKFLVPVIEESLTKQEDDEQTEWNVATAAGTCLQLIANTVLDEVVPVVMPFVQKYITDTNWRFAEAAILAFGSILEGPNGYIITELVSQAIPILLARLADPVILVKDTTAWTLGRVCQLHPQTVLPKLSDVMRTFLEALRDEPRIASKICWAIHNIAESQEDSADKSTGPLSPYFQNLAELLVNTTDREDADENFLSSAAYEALNVLIQNSAKDCQKSIAVLLPLFLGRLEKSFSAETLSSDDKKRQTELQGNLCSALQACTQKLEGEVRQFADGMMRLYLRVFESTSAAVHEEVLMAVGAIANAVEQDFIRYMPSFHKWLELALRNWEEYMVCGVAVGVVGDISRALGEKIAPYCDVLVGLLLENLRNPSINRLVKPPILSCFGDIAIAIGGKFEKYLAIVMNMLQQASTTPVTDLTDYDFVDYVNQLREDIFEAYTSIIQGLRTDNKAEAFLPHVEHVVGFVGHVWNDSTRTEGVTRGAVGVLGDLAHALGHTPKVKSILSHDMVQTILNECATSNVQHTRDVVKWTKSVIAKV
eukprot:TRINITY_DN482_c0_g1_i1.p1 TRINITY_DN482_c0_g1~~TRINITY_DN482_c0_g1_i1.p1  ORF type:complete len:853 (-),score=130.53 TRINITY_DN482_c0_g1_i1:37-2595(-)